MKRVIHFSSVSGRESRFDATADGAIDKLLCRRKDTVDHQYDVEWGTQDRHKPATCFSTAPRFAAPNSLSWRQYAAEVEEQQSRPLLHPRDDLLSTNRFAQRPAVSFPRRRRDCGAAAQTGQLATKRSHRKEAAAAARKEQGSQQQQEKQQGEAANSAGAHVGVLFDVHLGRSPSIVRSSAGDPALAQPANSRDVKPRTKAASGEKKRPSKLLRAAATTLPCAKAQVAFPDIAGNPQHVSSPYDFDKVPGRDGISPERQRQQQKKRLPHDARGGSGTVSAPLVHSADAVFAEENAATLGSCLFPAIARGPAADDMLQRQQRRPSAVEGGALPMGKPSQGATATSTALAPLSASPTKRRGARDVMYRITLDAEAPTRDVKAPLFRSYIGREAPPLHLPRKERFAFATELQPERGLKCLTSLRPMPQIAFPKALRFPELIAAAETDETRELLFGADEVEGEDAERRCEESGSNKSSPARRGSKQQHRRRSRIRWNEAGEVELCPDTPPKMMPVRRGGQQHQEARNSLSTQQPGGVPAGSSKSPVIASRADVEKEAEGKRRRQREKARSKVSAYSRTGSKISVDLRVIFSSKRFKELLRAHDEELEYANYPPGQAPPEPESYDEAVALAEKRDRVDRLKHLSIEYDDDCGGGGGGHLPKRLARGAVDLFLGPARFDAATAPSTGPLDPYERQPRSTLRSALADEPELPLLLAEEAARQAFDAQLKRDRAEQQAESEEARRRDSAAAPAAATSRRVFDALAGGDVVTSSLSSRGGSPASSPTSSRRSPFSSEPSPVAAVAASSPGAGKDRGRGAGAALRKRSVLVVSPRLDNVGGSREVGAAEEEEAPVAGLHERSTSSLIPGATTGAVARGAVPLGDVLASTAKPR